MTRKNLNKVVTIIPHLWNNTKAQFSTMRGPDPRGLIVGARVPFQVLNRAKISWVLVL